MIKDGHDDDTQEGPTMRTQYDKLANDWRHINTIIWGIPAVAVTIMAGVIVAAYGKELEGWPRLVLLGVGALFLFALTVEVVKKRLLMNAISARLQFLERGPKIEFPSSTDDLIDYVDQNVKDNLDKKDPVYNLFLWSYARQYLAMVIFVAAILVSLLAEWEFIKDFPYEEWAHVIGIAPITLISIIIAVWRYRKSQEWKHFRNLLNKIDKVDKTKIDKSKEEITDSYRKGEISELHYNLLNEKILKMTSKEGTRNNS